VKVCFVCPYAYPLFDPEVLGKFGGAEVYAWLFARGLAADSNFEVSFAVFDHGQPAGQELDGIRVFTLPSSDATEERLASDVRQCIERQAEFPWLKVKRWRSRLLWEAPLLAALRVKRVWQRRAYWRNFDYAPRRRVLLRDDADVYCAFGAHHLTAEVVALCRRWNRKSVVLLQSDYDLLSQYYCGSRELNMYGEPGHACYFGLAHADYIVSQTEPQQALLQERFRRNSVLIRQPIELTETNLSPAPVEGERFALWIGKSDAYKRPELCLQLARRCPEISFLMIMNRAVESVFREVMENLPENVRVIEQVKFTEIESYIRQAKVLVSTSAYEGFPHVFLQAGKFGVPVVSLTVDPDRFLEQYGCGIASHDDLDAMANAVRLVWQEGAEAGEMSRRIRDYVRSKHEFRARAAELAEAIKEVAASSRRFETVQSAR
jgi:glycosyltransferase involved in cell wall biosynthesis